MERFYLEEPSPVRKTDALDFVKEFEIYNSNLYGAGGFKRYLNDYEGWIKKLEEDKHRKVDEEHVPARTYFFVRESDKRIVGIINIRLALNEQLKSCGGNIGYSIRPTERGKGYNNINLYLGLKVCNSYDIDEVLLFADLENPASWKTMEFFGGERVSEYFNQHDNAIEVKYRINVKNALEIGMKFDYLICNNQ